MPFIVPSFLKTRIENPAILGGAVSGDGAQSLLSKLGVRGVVYDRTGAEFTAERARTHRLVIFSPGFSPRHPWLQIARSGGCMCMAELDFASVFWAGRVIAVTGTNGKTTLTEFLAHALTAGGRRARGAGNIGVAFTRVVAEEDGGSPEITAVCEVSSFQSEQLGHFYADALLWTNFAEDHLERHAGMEAYFAAKWELVLRSPPDRFFAGPSVARSAEQFGRPLTPRACVQTEGLPEDPRLAGSPFASYPQRENFVIARAWWLAEGLAEDTLYAAAKNFRLGRHRLNRVATIAGVNYWNDSKATNFHAVEAALAGFTRPPVLIAGGRSKGGDVTGFVRRIAPRVTHAYLIGETAPVLAAACDSFGVAHTEAPGLEEAVRRAAASAPAGSDVLLSPGFSSFDMFRNYEDRGDCFERAVAALPKT